MKKHFFFLLLFIFSCFTGFSQARILPTGFDIQDGSSINTTLENGSLIFENDFGFIAYDNMALNNSSITFINDGGWTTSRFGSTGAGSSGQLELFAGGGTGLIVQAGPDFSNLTRGRMFIYDNGANKIEFRIVDGGGIINTNGNNGSDNAFISWPSGRPDVGYIAVEDVSGQIQAGLVVASNGDGEVFGDTKNFRMDHPQQPGKEIWYASLEGPEAGAYERGTARLDGGEVFVPYSDHFSLVINPETVTVILTPHATNTYGLAVIRKQEDGFWIKELKNGKSNFSFDWEVKGVRKGYEDYRIIRDKSEILSGHKTEENAVGNLNEHTNQKARNEASEKQQNPTFALFQNRPNPFHETTFIDYSLPESTVQAELRIFNGNGRLVQTHALTPGSQQQIIIAAGSLPAGVYYYSIFAKDKLLSTRKMVLTPQ